MKASSVYAAILVSAGLAVFACSSKPPPPKAPTPDPVADAGQEAEAAPPPPKSLFERLGKQDGIAKIVDAFTKDLAADTKFNKRLAGIKGPKLDKLKKDLSDQLCVATGGPDAGADCKYDGRFMKEALGAKTKIKEEEWNAMMLDLRSALEENKVADTEMGDLASVVGGFRDDVVIAPPAPKH